MTFERLGVLKEGRMCQEENEAGGRRRKCSQKCRNKRSVVYGENIRRRRRIEEMTMKAWYCR